MSEAEYARLRTLIDEALERGESRLPPEPRLSEELGISRGRLRTLLKKLEREEAIWRHVGKGTFVGPRKLIDPPSGNWSFSMDDILQARLAIEPQLAAQAAMHCNADDLAALEACLAEMQQAPSMSQWKRLDERLHRTIAQATHNPLLLALYDTLRSQMKDTLDKRIDQVLGTAPVPKEETEAEHFRMVQAIRDHDPLAAKAAMRDHIRSVRERLFGLR